MDPDEENPDIVPGYDAFAETPGTYTGVVVVLTPSADDPVVAASSEPAHATVIFAGDTSTVDEATLAQIIAEVAAYAADLDGPVVAPVSQVGTLGEDDATVAFVDAVDSLVALRDGLIACAPTLAGQGEANDKFYGQWTPHVTLGYPETPPNAEYDGDEITFDALGVWAGENQMTFPMGGTVTASASQVGMDEEVDDEPTLDEIPIHGVLAPEGVLTGDGRGFRPGALSTRPLPVPYRYEYVSSHGGNQTSQVATVGRVDQAWLDEESNMWRFAGVLIMSKPYANEALAALIDGSGTGVSIDADNMAVDMESFSDAAIAEANEKGMEPPTWYSQTRVAGLTQVPIPAFFEAYAGLGDTFEEDMSDEDREAAYAALTACGCIDVSPIIVDVSGDPEANARAAAAAEALEFRDVPTDERKRLAGNGQAMPDGSFPIANVEDLRNAIQSIGRASDPDKAKAHIKKRARELGHPELIPGDWSGGVEAFVPGTHDGPGWITNPVATSRIRRYWTHGKGAAKIRWGEGGDFNRCRLQLAKYVQNPEWLAGLCANMHHEALGIWPATHAKQVRHALVASGGIPADIMTITADAATAARVYPSEWFANPQFDRITPLTVDKGTGRVYGHLAQWGVCHIGVAGVCQEPPHSNSGYANFLKGVVDTEAGEQVVGCLTYGIGHADPRLRASAATAHYDRIDAVTSYVNVGEDAYGIWYAGVLRPGVTDDQIDEMRAIGALSGDWRACGRYGLDLVAAVSVNTPGFPIPAFSVENGMQMSLIAAGFVAPAVLTQGETHEEFVQAVAERVIALQVFSERRKAARERVMAFRLEEARRRQSGRI